MMNYRCKDLLNTCLTLLVWYQACIPTAQALTYSLPKQGKTVGEFKKITSPANNTLASIAEMFGVGILEMREANPHLPKNLKPGTSVVIPTQFNLPSAPHIGLVLNLADMRIFYFHPDKAEVSTYPVGIGKQGWSTPLGTSSVISKQANPVWHPPQSIRAEALKAGKILPAEVPAGPHSPLGQYALRLGFENILIHGTNDPKSVGLRSSHGCIRMRAGDIQELFRLAPIGTPIRVVYEAHQKD